MIYTNCSGIQKFRVVFWVNWWKNMLIWQRITCTDICFTAWESYNVTLLEVVFGVQTFIGGDQFRPEENSLILLNHRTRNDWNFMWSALFHATHPMSHNAKFVLKEDVKILPGPGKLFFLLSLFKIPSDSKGCAKVKWKITSFNYLSNSHLSTRPVSVDLRVSRISAS